MPSPSGGLLDDAAVIGWVIAEVKGELDAFCAWEEAQTQAPETPLPALPASEA